MKSIFPVFFCLLGITTTACVKKMGSQAIGAVYSCSVKKGQTHQTCTEFKALSSSELAYFKQKCSSDNTLDTATWQDVGCSTEARQGGCEMNFNDNTSNISTTFVAWGYTATALAAITSPTACENNGGKIVQP
ncbi:MAG: hypothetical protein RIR26_614 [Pseudomonadota bacterium]|jgi:hypothetical protein